MVVVYRSLPLQRIMFLTIVEKDFILLCYKGIICKTLMLGLWFWVGKKTSWLVIMSKIHIGKRTMKRAFIRFKLMWDVTYPMHPWFYSPFKGKNNGLSWKKVHWNFIKCSSQMAIESAFGLLKGRSRILLIKKIDLPFHHLLDIVIIYFSSHNLIIIHRNAFDMD